MSANVIHRRDFLGRLGKVSLGTLAAGGLSVQAVDSQGKPNQGTWKPVS